MCLNNGIEGSRLSSMTILQSYAPAEISEAEEVSLQKQLHADQERLSRFVEVFAAPATSAELLLPIMHKFWQSEVFYVFHTVLFGSYGRYQWTMLSFFKRLQYIGYIWLFFHQQQKARGMGDFGYRALYLKKKASRFGLKINTNKTTV